MCNEISTKKLDRTRRVLDAAPGFEFDYVGAWGLVEVDGNEVGLGFNHNRSAAHTYIQLHRGPTSAWARRVGTELRRAGYTLLAQFKDEVAHQRFLRGGRQCVAEVRRLAELRHADDLRTWPTRQPTPEPQYKRRRAPQSCADMYDVIVQRGTLWTEIYLNYVHRVRAKIMADEEIVLNLFVAADTEPSADPRIRFWPTLNGPFEWGRKPPKEKIDPLVDVVRGLGFRRNKSYSWFDANENLAVESALWKFERVIERLEGRASDYVF